MERTFDFNNKTASVLAALLICSKAINAVVGSYYSGSIPVGMLVLGSVWALYFVYCLFHGLTINSRSVCFIGFLLLYFAVSLMAVGGYAKNLILEFIEYGILGFLIGQLDLNIEKVTRYAGYLLIVMFVPFYSMIQNDLEGTRSSTVQMGTSYVILPIVFAAIVHFIYFRKKTNFFLMISYVLAFLLSVYLIINGTRGASICFATLIFLVLMNTKRARARNYKIGTVILIVLIVFCVINIGTLLSMLNNALANSGIQINFLRKSVNLLNEQGDITNGRLKLYGIAWKGFLQSPIWGNGIGAFGNLGSIHRYPHNMFLQALYEGGLLLGVPIIGFTVWIVYKVLFGGINDDNARVATILFVSSSIPAVMFTGEFWDYQILWMLFGFFFMKGFFKNEYCQSRSG